MKGESISPDSSVPVGPASSGGSPRVVVGIPDSEPPPSAADSEAPPPVIEMKAPVTMPSFTKTLVQEFTPPSVQEFTTAEEPEAPAAAEEREASPPPEPVAEAAPVDVAPPAPKVDLQATLVHGSSELVADEARKPIEGALLPQAKDRLEELRQRKDNRERLKQARIVAEAAVKRDAPADPDEVSVPPAGDLEVEDQHFFDRGEKEAAIESQRMIRAAAEAEAEELIPEKARRKSMPHIVQRRAKLAGYVKVAVAGAAIVCLAALGRTAIHKSSSAPAQAAQVTHAEIKTEPAPPPPVEVKAAEPAAAPVPEPAPAPAPAATEEAKAAEPAAAEPPKEEVTGDAKEELKKAHVALERRKIADAIEAGEKSVTLDPTSGEAWLILGAAYQEKGDMVNARRCYSSCVKEGKTGPRLECQKMLRF